MNPNDRGREFSRRSQSCTASIKNDCPHVVLKYHEDYVACAQCGAVLPPEEAA